MKYVSLPHNKKLNLLREHSLGCGVQRARRVTIEYFPKPNQRLATVGEVATIEFQ